jgi:hypothetical protein
MAYIRRTYGTYLARFFLRPASIRDLAAKGRAELEQNQDNLALNDGMQGADFLRKSAL